MASSLVLLSAPTTGTLSGLGSQIVHFGNVNFSAGASWLVDGSTAGIGGGEVFNGFASGDTLDIAGVINESVLSFDPATSTLKLGGSANLNIVLPGDFTMSSFTVMNDTTGGTDLTLACFAQGTRIMTEAGEVAVERLREGDLVTTMLGRKPAPIVWLGWRRSCLGRHPRPMSVQPIRVRTGALGEGRPHTDLCLSPDHAVLVGDMLVPVRLLVNGDSIVQENVPEVTYYHLELAEHDIVLAEGMLVESYLETGGRSSFNGFSATSLHPDFGMHRSNTSSVWEALGCAKLIVAGAQLGAARQFVNARAVATRSSATHRARVA